MKYRTWLYFVKATFLVNKVEDIAGTAKKQKRDLRKRSKIRKYEYWYLLDYY